ncbi:DUF2612 domain-containing protein [Uliginosibacterium sp. sgz301328]|uniref:DUF2612 domain-containing protein n=1 Tax=Uliginosibacterium sp. sgz301328 TaxID=3243764 RepID=UPI00359D8CF7
MATADDYVGLITSEHNDKPKYVAMVRALASAIADQNNVTSSLPDLFSLDSAVGVQLDAVGLWVGISRIVAVPIDNVYFSFDIDGLGFDLGVWKGPYDPDSGLTHLDDDTYRLFLRAKIGANNWDGTLGQSKAILDLIFNGGTYVFIQDNQDMSMDIVVSGDIPSPVFMAILFGGYLPLKPEGVRVNGYYSTSAYGAPVFGFDVDNQYIGGFDRGAWATSDLTLINQLMALTQQVVAVAPDVHHLVHVLLPEALTYP